MIKSKQFKRNGTPFQKQCGLPLGVENSEPNKRRVREMYTNAPCRDGIFDELGFGKPKAKKK